MISNYRQRLIEALIARDGEHCRYCKIKVRRNWMLDNRYDHDATVDHVIPKAKGGRNHMENYALACRKCNHTKGDRSVEEFMAAPVPVRRRVRRAPRPIIPIEPAKLYVAPLTLPVEYPNNPKAQAAFEAVYSKRKKVLRVEYKPPPKLSGLELARRLHAQFGPWPLA
jgi:hypothetical protein